jgi:hypothetical protein
MVFGEGLSAEEASLKIADTTSNASSEGETPTTSEANESSEGETPTTTSEA